MFVKLIVTITALGLFLALPDLASAWNAAMIRSTSNPGTRGADLTVGNVVATTIASGQTFTLTAKYAETCLSNSVSSGTCPNAGTSGTATEIRRAYVFLHQPESNEWLYFYVVREAAIPSTFTAWAYSPYVDTARGSEDFNRNAQRLTESGQIRLTTATADPTGARAVPTAGNAQVMLTKTRGAFTVTGVRTYTAGNELLVEWQLQARDFPTGLMNVYTSVETRTHYDGWNRVTSLQLQ
ncbi:MAG: hypothetical protein HY329_05835 [Chloroflexi bacterium]|nr:hypothetical protein [Chloroflexota bacterium]